MKHVLPQVIVGVVIVLASVYLTGWMIHIAPDIPDTDPVQQVELVPEHPVLYGLAKYGSFALPLLGLGIVIAGVYRADSGRPASLRGSAYLAVSGILIVGLGIVILIWGFPTSFHSVQPVTTGNGEFLLHVFSNPGYLHEIPQNVTFSLVFVGLLATGYGIVHYLKTNKETARPA